MLVVAAVAVAACGRVNFRMDPIDAASRDAGGLDAAAIDAGAIDAGGVEAGDVDAGAIDAGGLDAGAIGLDGGGRSVTMVTVAPVTADCDPVPIVVQGSGFVGGMTVTITDSLGATIAAQTVTVLDPTNLVASAVFAGAAPGLADLAVTWPGGGTVTSPAAVGIATSPFATAVFVDGDTTEVPADGTRASPYPAINAGITAARPRGVPVLVDGSTSPYAEFTLVNGASVIGCPWSAGAVRPVVTWNDRHVIESGANAVVIAGLDFAMRLVATGEGIVFTQGSAITIRDCKFSGDATVPDASFVVLDRSMGVEIVDSWFTRLHHTAVPGGVRVLRVIDVRGAQGFHLHRSELSDIGFTAAGTALSSAIEVVRVHADAMATVYPHDVRVHNVLVHDVFQRCNGANYLSVLDMGNVNSFDYVGVFEVYDVTIDDLRHADTPAATNVTEGHVNGMYLSASGGTRTWRDNIVAHIAETDDVMVAGSSSYYGAWCDGFLVPGPSPQPMSNSLVFDVGTPLPVGANSVDWASGFVNQVTAGTGSFRNSDAIDPGFVLTDGPSFYHPTNPAIATGASDGGEMGAFGGPEGSWTPLSQR